MISAAVHEGRNYRITCQKDDCEFDKVSSTDWGADSAARHHFHEGHGHECIIRELDT